jgi:hypothetical protein
MALIGARRRIEHDHAVVHVPVRDVQLVCSRIYDHVRRAAHIPGVVAAGVLPLPADLEQKPPAARELQDLRVLLAAAAEPDVVLVIDVDPVLEIGPLVPVIGTAPRRDDVSLGIEFQHRRRRAPDRPRFVRLEGGGPMDDPDVVP